MENNLNYAAGNGLQVNKPEHLQIAEKMANEILNLSEDLSIEMVLQISMIVKEAINSRIEGTISKQKYLTDCLNKLKNT